MAAGPQRESAPLVLVLHGFPDTADSFRPLLKALAGAGLRAAAVYQRGYAPTELAADRDYSPLMLGRDVLALIEHFGVEKAWLVGHDWGAVAAYAAAAMRPDRVAGVVAASVPHLRRYLLRLSRGQLRASRYMLRFQWPGAERALARDGFAALDALVREWSPGWTPPADWLQRVRATSPQSELDAAARRRNLRDAFRAEPGHVEGRHLLLLDDVVTTGTTVREALVFSARLRLEESIGWDKVREGRAAGRRGGGSWGGVGWGAGGGADSPAALPLAVLFSPISTYLVSTSTPPGDCHCGQRPGYRGPGGTGRQYRRRPRWVARDVWLCIK